jgi:hypothetical protein
LTFGVQRSASDVEAPRFKMRISTRKIRCAGSASNAQPSASDPALSVPQAEVGNQPEKPAS